MMNLYLGRVALSVGSIFNPPLIQKGTRVFKSLTALNYSLSNQIYCGRYAGLGSGASAYALAEALNRFKKKFEASNLETSSFRAVYEDLEHESDLNIKKLMLSELSILSSIESDRVNGDPGFGTDYVDEDGMYFHFADTEFYVEMKRPILVFHLQK